MKININKKILLIVCVAILILIGVAFWFIQRQTQTNINSSDSLSQNLDNESTEYLFAQRAKAVGFYTFLETDGPFTIFMPTDEAYEILPDRAKTDINSLTDDANLRQILLHHIVKGNYPTSSFKDGMTLETIQGEELTITKKNGQWLINNYATIQTADYKTKNGIVHIINEYLLPASLLY